MVKITQNHPKMTDFWPILTLFVPILGHFDLFLAPKRLKMVKRGIKTPKNGGLKMQFGRTENANANNAKKKSNSQGKRGVQDKKNVQNGSKFFSGAFGAGCIFYFQRIKWFFSPRKKARKCKKMQKMQPTREKSPFRQKCKKKMQKNVCFIGRKRASIFSAQFCIILVNFGRILHIFAFSCIILLNVVVNFPKYHQEIAKWP